MGDPPFEMFLMMFRSAPSGPLLRAAYARDAQKVRA